MVGPLGRGWPHSWDLSLTIQPDGTVLFTDQLGTPSAFTPDDSGEFIAPSGSQEILTRQGDDSFILQKETGERLRFLPGGRLDFVEDHNGNRITASYDASNRMVHLEHSSGQALDITYNAAGLITQVADSLGLTSVFTYDAANQHLLSATDYRGLITRYTYDTTDGSASEHALISVEYPDGSHQFYEYDALGRLSEMHRDGDAQAFSFTYGSAAMVTTTNASGDSSDVYFDANGRSTRFSDQLNNVVQMTYDDDLSLTEIVNGAGNLTSFGYDERGNLTSLTDALGQETLHEFGGGPLDRVSSMTDPNAQVVSYEYDAIGNLTYRNLADGSVEGFSYDSRGLLQTLDNRRGQTITFT